MKEWEVHALNNRQTSNLDERIGRSFYSLMETSHTQRILSTDEGEEDSSEDQYVTASLDPRDDAHQDLLLQQAVANFYKDYNQQPQPSDQREKFEYRERSRQASP